MDRNSSDQPYRERKTQDEINDAQERLSDPEGTTNSNGANASIENTVNDMSILFPGVKPELVLTTYVYESKGDDDDPWKRDSRDGVGFSRIRKDEFAFLAKNEPKLKAYMEVYHPDLDVGMSGSEYEQLMKDNSELSVVCNYSMFEYKRVQSLKEQGKDPSTDVTDSFTTNDMISRYYGSSLMSDNPRVYDTGKVHTDNINQLMLAIYSVDINDISDVDTGVPGRPLSDNINTTDTAGIANANIPASAQRDNVVTNMITDASTISPTTFVRGADGDFVTPEEAYAALSYQLTNVANVNIAGIIGAPPRFSTYSDPRLGMDNNGSPSTIKNIYGRTYTEHFIKYANIVTLAPGVPNFMPSMDKGTKQEAMSLLIKGSVGSVGALQSDVEDDKNTIVGIMENAKNKDRPTYFGFANAEARYAQHVQRLITVAAGMFNISDGELAKALDANELAILGDKPASAFRTFKLDNNTNLSETLAKLTGTGDSNGEKINSLYYNTSIYNNGPIENSEGITNVVGESMFSSMLRNPVSDTLREASFLLSTPQDENTTGDAIRALGKGKVIEAAESTLKGLAGFGGDPLKYLGGSISLPKVFKSSSYTKQYNLSVKLSSPSGDKMAFFKNILIPLIRLMPYFLPQQFGWYPDSMISPFLVQVYARGLVACEMGIVTQVSIDRNVETASIDNLPTEMDIKFTVEDLNPFLSIPYKPDDTELGAYHSSGMMPFLSTLAGIPIYRGDGTKAFDRKMTNISSFISKTILSPGRTVHQIQNKTEAYIRQELQFKAK